jgi:16S rRNA (uracil1498-N3)-methyltransferase
VLPATAAHAFVTDLDALDLAADDEHHLFRVLRLRPGEALTVSDGAGRWRAARVAGAGRGLEADGEIVTAPRPLPAVTIAFSITKGERPEWVVQKLTELGVDEVVPMTTQHSVVRWDAAKAAKAQDRFSEIARAAAMQARLAYLPRIAPLTSFAEVLSGHDPTAVALAHPGGDTPSLGRPAVLIGPEGGWSAEELAAAPATVDLGPTTLRADTAALAAAVRLCALRANHRSYGAE